MAQGTDPWPAVDERLDGAILLGHALDQIRPEEQEVLLLVVWEELSVAGAARTLGLPAGTAAVACTRLGWPSEKTPTSPGG